MLPARRLSLVLDDNGNIAAADLTGVGQIAMTALNNCNRIGITCLTGGCAMTGAKLGHARNVIATGLGRTDIIKRTGLTNEHASQPL